MKNLFRKIRESSKNDNFLHLVEKLQVLVSKLLSITMIVLVLIAIVDLIMFVVNKLLMWDFNEASFNKNLFTAFGLFLNILIALEILENITASSKIETKTEEILYSSRQSRGNSNIRGNSNVRGNYNSQNSNRGRYQYQPNFSNNNNNTSYCSLSIIQIFV